MYKYSKEQINKGVITGSNGLLGQSLLYLLLKEKNKYQVFVFLEEIIGVEEKILSIILWILLMNFC